jgi:hypothetical protein
VGEVLGTLHALGFTTLELLERHGAGPTDQVRTLSLAKSLASRWRADVFASGANTREYDDCPSIRPSRSFPRHLQVFQLDFAFARSDSPLITRACEAAEILGACGARTQ